MNDQQKSAAEAALFPYQNGQAPVQGMNTNTLACPFPAPPSRSQYCFPAPFSQVNGQKYQNLTQAYGQSRQVPT